MASSATASAASQRVKGSSTASEGGRGWEGADGADEPSTELHQPCAEGSPKRGASESQNFSSADNCSAHGQRAMPGGRKNVISICAWKMAKARST